MLDSQADHAIGAILVAPVGDAIVDTFEVRVETNRWTVLWPNPKIQLEAVETLTVSILAKLHDIILKGHCKWRSSQENWPLWCFSFNVGKVKC